MSSAVRGGTKVLVGFSERKHTFYGAAPEDTYLGAIPLEDVREKVFYWEAKLGAPVFYVEDETTGELTSYFDPTRVGVVREETGETLGVHGNGSYALHQYPRWLLDSIAPALDGELGIGLVAEQKGGASAAVSVEMPETIKTPEGVEFRPQLFAHTSHDASLATTYRQMVSVFGHPMAPGMSKRVRGKSVRKVRHSKHSLGRFPSATEAATELYEIVDEFQEDIITLISMTLDDVQWQEFLDAYIPIPKDDGATRTHRMERQGVLTSLYRSDPRIAAWAGTAWGVLLAVNIANHEKGIVRGGDRDMRNLSNMVYGAYVKAEQDALKKLQEVLNRKFAAV